MKKNYKPMKGKINSKSKLQTEENRKKTTKVDTKEIPAIDEKFKRQNDNNVLNSNPSANLQSNSSDTNLNKRRGDKIRSCEKCLKIDLQKTLIECYVCKKKECKECIGNIRKIKKKDHSNYICQECMQNDSIKKRKTISNLNFDVLLDYINFGDQKEPALGYKRRRNMNRPAILKEKVEKDFIDMNAVHDCMSLPSEINSENLAESEIIESFRNTKDKKLFTCHQCLRNDEKTQFRKCLDEQCGNFYCLKCIKLYKKDIFDFCFFCKKICFCVLCITNRNNKMDYEVEKLSDTKNLVRIENFLILENADDMELSVVENESKGNNSEINQNVNKSENIINHEQSKTQIKNSIQKSNIVKFQLDRLESEQQENKEINRLKSNLKKKDHNRKKSRINFIKNKSNKLNQAHLHPSKNINNSSKYINLSNHNELINNADNIRDSELGSNLRQPPYINQNQFSHNANNTISFLNDYRNLQFLEQNRFRANNQENFNQNFINHYQNLSIGLHRLAPQTNTIDLNEEKNKILIEELKKSFFSAQYFTVMQKIYISYIMKNIELILSNFCRIQNCEEVVLNSIANSIKNNLINSNTLNLDDEPNMICNLNNQMNLLRNINLTGSNMTNAFNSNFDNLKSCGMKIFNAMNPIPESSNLEKKIEIKNTNFADNKAGVPLCKITIHDNENNVNSNKIISIQNENLENLNSKNSENTINNEEIASNDANIKLVELSYEKFNHTHIPLNDPATNFDVSKGSVNIEDSISQYNTLKTNDNGELLIEPKLSIEKVFKADDGNLIDVGQKNTDNSNINANIKLGEKINFEESNKEKTIQKKETKANLFTTINIAAVSLTNRTASILKELQHVKSNSLTKEAEN